VTRILITGAAGFLGAALAARLRADGDEVVGIDPARVRGRAYFGHLFRMLGRRGPICIPTAPAVAPAHAADALNRARGRRNDVNAISMRYLARTGTYSIDKARRMLGYEPSIDVDDGMRRTEGLAAW
jgi:nucleoside-diphosphate-sugar epimerase